VLLVDGNFVLITTSVATTNTFESIEVLEKMRTEMQADLQKIKDDGNAEDIEKALAQIAKVESEERLARIKG
jgi:hypothetical protein